MTGIITRVAYFEMNPDRLTGQIVYPNGERSRKCYTKWQAKQLAITMRDVNLDDAEVKALVEAIDRTDMIESDTKIELFADRVTEVEDRLRSGCRPD